MELYVRWMQEIRRFKPSTVSRRLSVMTGFYRTCVIDGVLSSSPAKHVRRPNVPPESPTLGLTHLQFEAILTAARLSTNPNDFALVAIPRRPPSHRPRHRRKEHGSDPPDPTRHPDGPARRHPTATHPRQPRRGPTTADAPTHAPAHLRHHHARRRRRPTRRPDRRRHADPRTTMRYDRARKNLDRHPNYILAAYMASGT